MADDNPLLGLYAPQPQGGSPLLSLYGPQGQQPPVDLGDKPKPKQPPSQEFQVYGGEFHAVPEKAPTDAKYQMRQYELKKDREDIPFDDKPQSDLDRAMKTPTDRYFGTAAPPLNIKPPVPDNANTDPIARPPGTLNRTEDIETSLPRSTIFADIEKTRQQAVQLGAEATGVSDLRDIYSGQTPWAAAVGGMVPMALGGPEEELSIVKGAKAVKGLFGDTSTPLGKEVAGGLRKALGTAARSTEQTRAELAPYQQTIALMPEQDRFNLLDYMERRSGGAQIGKSMQGYANEFRKQMNLRKDMIKNAGLQAGVIEDYVTHFWQDPSSARAFIGSWGKQGSGQSLKERTLPTIAEGIKAGLVPLTSDPNEIAMRYVTSMDKHIAIHEMLNAAESAGHLQYFKDTREVPDGWVKVNLPRMDAYAPKEWANIWNNFASKGVYGNVNAGDAYQAFRNLSNIVTQTRLAFSGYHLLAMAQEAITSDLVRGVGQVIGGLHRLDADNVLRGFGNIGKAPIAPFLNYRTGKKFQELYLSRGAPDLANIFAEAGGRAVSKTHAFDYTLSKYGSFERAWKKGYLKAEMAKAPGTFSGAFVEAYQKVLKAGGNRTMAYAAAAKAQQTAKSIVEIMSRSMSTIMAPLFEKYIPMLKNAAFSNEMGMWMSLNPQATREEQIAQATKLIDSIDNRFGEMIQDNIMWHTGVKQAATAGMLSYSWNLGSLRLIAGGGKDILKTFGRAFDPASKHYSPNAAWIIAFPMATALLATAYLFLKTGKRPQKVNDLVFPPTGGTAPGFGQRGQFPELALLPGYQKEIYGWYYNGIKEMQSKMSPLLQMGWQAFENQDWKGDPIRRPDATVPEWLSDYFNYVSSEMSPISLGRVVQGEKTGSHMGLSEEMMGIRPAPLYEIDPEGYRRGMTAIETQKWIKKIQYDVKHGIKTQAQGNAMIQRAREKQLKYGGPQQ